MSGRGRNSKYFVNPVDYFRCVYNRSAGYVAVGVWPVDIFQLYKPLAVHRAGLYGFRHIQESGRQQSTRFDCKMRLDVLTTGGTLDKVYFDAKSEYEVGDPVVGSLPEKMGVGFEYSDDQLMRVDSKQDGYGVRRPLSKVTVCECSVDFRSTSKLANSFRSINCSITGDTLQAGHALPMNNKKKSENCFA